ncbi:GntR family transcriptional regulator, partial [Streptomyces sp. SID7499]|nr:GntR family transcriptional regulator [Streptomyces sp. SID7499]
AADQLIAEHPVELVADLGPATYVGAHGMLVRHGVDLASPGLRVAIDHASEDLRMLVERVFAGREDIEWREASYMQLHDLFARNEVDATVWNLDEAQDRLGLGVDVVPLGDEVTRELALRNSTAAVIGRTEGAKALAAVRESLDLSTVTRLQSEVLRGERVP